MALKQLWPSNSDGPQTVMALKQLWPLNSYGLRQLWPVSSAGLALAELELAAAKNDEPVAERGVDRRVRPVGTYTVTWSI